MSDSLDWADIRRNGFSSRAIKKLEYLAGIKWVSLGDVRPSQYRPGYNVVPMYVAEGKKTLGGIYSDGESPFWSEYPPSKGSVEKQTHADVNGNIRYMALKGIFNEMDAEAANEVGHVADNTG